LYTKQHPLYCGIALHARTMSVCILHQAGDTLWHRNMAAPPAALLQAMAPSRAPIVRAAACLVTWYWLADLCAAHGRPCVLGHALSRQAIHGGKATNAPSDAQTIAALLRGGMRPQASVSPVAMRATRALRRRRRHLARKRAARLAHGHHTTDTATRDGGAERCADPAVHKSLAGDRARITSADALGRAVARPSVTTAHHHAAQPWSLLHTGPGLGKRLSLVFLYAIHDIHRFPRVQDCVSSGRLGQCAQASAGPRLGPAGSTRGKAPLPWAVSDAAVLCLRDPPAAQQPRARVEKPHDTGQAVTVWAQQVARAVSPRLPRPGACEREPCCQCSGRGAEEPGAALDTPGTHLHQALATACSPASLHAKVPRGRDARRPAPLLGHPLALLGTTVHGAHGLRGLLLPRAGLSLDHATRCASPVHRTG
jgi:hypothetical protein